MALQNAGNYEQARAGFQDLIARQPDYKDSAARLKQVNTTLADSYYQRGVAAASQESWADAVANFDKTLAIVPNYKDAVMQCAVAARVECHGDSGARANNASDRDKRGDDNRSANRRSNSYRNCRNDGDGGRSAGRQTVWGLGSTHGHHRRHRRGAGERHVGGGLDRRRPWRPWLGQDQLLTNSDQGTAAGWAPWSARAG